MMISSLIGFLFATLMFPVLQGTFPDVAAQTRTLFLFVSMPFGFLVAGCMRLPLPPMLREGLTLLANAVCASITMYLFALSRSADAPLFVAGIAVLLVYNTIGIQLRFRYALAGACLILAAFSLALHVRADTTVSEQRNLVLIVTTIAVYLMAANWRLEHSGRTSYLMILRERLQRQDLSERNLELNELARRDSLTGIANRRAYDAWMTAAWAQEGAQEKAGLGRLGLIVIDVDRFKAFNDFYGHAAGDSCLKKIATCLREQLRGTTDLVARLGGEEFAVLLPSLSEAHCADVAERLRLAVEQLELPNSGLVPSGLVPVSAGVASYVVGPSQSPADLFHASDSALYEAKLSGRNRVCVATAAAVAPTQVLAR